MKPEELLEMLRGNGLDDNAIQALLSDALASLQGPAEEKEVAGNLLGVEL